MDIKVGQVWLYQRTDQVCAPVVHIVTKVESELAESTSVFTSTGKAHERCILSGIGCKGRGVKQMVAGKDSVGVWTLLHTP